jgi:hypothetical protein
VYNVGHFGLRVWGLQAGWSRGLGVASELGNPVFRRGPTIIARLGAVVGGVMIPLAIATTVGANAPGVFLIAAIGAIGASALVLNEGRVPGWRAATWILAVLTLAAMVV